MSVKTLCKNCIFEHEPKACFVGRLDKIRQLQGVTIEEVDGHNVIHHRICDWSTPRYWNNLDETELRDLAWKVRVNRIIKVSFIITTSETTPLKDIAKTVRSLQNQQVEPALIHVINKSGVPIKDILALRKDSKVPLTATQVVLDDYDERYTWDKIQRINTIYYGIIRAGNTLPSSFIRKMDQEFNDNLNQFVYLEYEGVEIHSTLLSHELGGDYFEKEEGYKYRDKVLQWCKNNFLENLVQRWESI